MASKHQLMAGDGGASHITGMSKHQLHEIMSQMKTLIEKNQQQARQILVENPSLTKSLFQAQIMLGMIRPPQPAQNVKQALPPQPQQAMQPNQQPNTQPSKPPTDIGIQAQANAFQPQPPARQPYQPLDPHPSLSFQSHPMPPNAIPQGPESKFNFKGQIPSSSLPQSTQMPNLLPPPPLPSHPHPFIQPNMPMNSSQLPHPGHSIGVMHQPLQAPLPTQPRPPLQPFSNPPHSQFPQNSGFQQVNAPPPILSQPMFHSGANHQNSYPQGPPPLPAQPPPQHLYNKGNMQYGSDFSNQTAMPMQVERGQWNSGPPDSAIGGMPFPAPPGPPANPVQGGQPPRPPQQLTPEMENMLLQQVMSLTPEQINILPPEQRQQVLQLRHIVTMSRNG